MNDLMHDLVFAWRNALKRPGMALLIVVTLALGIGVNAAMLGATYQMLLAPLPFVDEDRLVRLEQNGLDYYPVDGPWSDATLNDVVAQQTSFAYLSPYLQGIFTLVGQGEPHQAAVGIVGAEFFDMLGVNVALGRGFEARDAEENAPPVMLLSQALWRDRFGGDPAAIGHSMEMSGVVYTVIGVLPELPPWPDANEAWIPTASDPYRVFQRTDAASNRASGYVLNVFAKLREAMTPEQAESDLKATAGRLAASYPDVYTNEYSITPRLVRSEMRGDSATLLLLPALAFLVLLIAVANVANLQLANLLVRSQELAVREALGADPGRIRRQLLAESWLLAFAGGVLGLAIAGPVLHLLAEYAVAQTPLAQRVGMDGSILLMIFVLSFGSGTLSALLASFRSRDINLALKEGGDKVTVSFSGARRRQLLMLVQFGLAFVVLGASALIMLSLYRLNRQDAGYDSGAVLELSMLVNQDLGASSEQRQVHLRNLGEQLRTRAEALPGVEATGFFGGAPLLRDVAWLRDASLEVDDPADAALAQSLNTRINFVSESWFEVMGIPLRQGRLFASTDAGGTPVAIVNASLAERFFPDGNAVGKVIRYAGTEFELPVVGVVENFRSRSLSADDEPAVYFYRQSPSDGLNFHVRSSGDLNELAEALIAIVHDIDPRQSVLSARPLQQARSEWLAPTVLRTALISLFGALALIVTLSGVVGVASYNIGRRVREIGVHMAVGANPDNVTFMFIAQSLPVYVAGLLLGLVTLLLFSPFLEPLLYQTSVLNPGVYVAVALLLSITVFYAVYLPARGAGRMNPMEALHAE